MILSSYAGLQILYDQVSKESPQIGQFLFRLFQQGNKNIISQLLKQKSEIFEQICQYSLQFFYNGGNYLGYGDTKFIPRCEQKDFIQIAEQLIKLSSKDKVAINLIYNLDKVSVGMDNNKQQTTYYTGDLTKDDIEQIDKILIEQKIMLETTQIVFNEEAKQYSIQIPSKQQNKIDSSKTYKGRKIIYDFGKYSQEIRKIQYHLNNALQYVNNDRQKNMIEKLIQYYQVGNCELHKDYSGEWVQDIDPSVETYQGFIETYKDPIGVRAEFESMVAYQDKDSYQVLNNLIKPDVATSVLQLLPVEQFMQKDLTNISYNGINILSFITCGLPIGINLPNYDDTRLKYGNKNVSLINVLAAGVQSPRELQFIDEQLQNVIFPLQKQCLSAEVALHELFGHGSCKLFYENDYNQLSEEQKMYLNYKHYQENETYTSVFKSLQSPFEECRAELSAFYLNGQELVFKLFRVAPYDYENYKITGIYSMIECALRGLQQFSQGKWMQAHSQARFVILNYVCRNTKAIQIQLQDNDNLLIQIDKNKIYEVFQAYKQLLKEFNIYRTSGDINQAQKIFSDLSTVDGDWIEIQKRCLLAQKPRKVFVGVRLQVDKQNNYYIENVEYTEQDKYYQGVMTYIQNISLSQKIQ